MPLLDPFRPPLRKRRHWQNLHSAWASALLTDLNGSLLPPRYFAEVRTSVGKRFEVRVLTDDEVPRLVGVVELISPANKGRLDRRRQFAIKCVSYLQQGAGVVLVDAVTVHSGNLHNELLERLEASSDGARLGKHALYASAYRAVPANKAVQLECWVEPLAVGGELPTMPLWIAPDLCLPLNLEQAYKQACKSSRIPEK